MGNPAVVIFGSIRSTRSASVCLPHWPFGQQATNWTPISDSLPLVDLLLLILLLLLPSSSVVATDDNNFFSLQGMQNASVHSCSNMNATLQHHTASGRPGPHYTFSPFSLGVHCTSNPSSAGDFLFFESLVLILFSLLAMSLILLLGFGSPVASLVNCSPEDVASPLDD